jgi:hypothetical protein
MKEQNNMMVLVRHLALSAEIKRRIDAGKPLMELPMPNGKRLGDCTGDDLRQIAAELEAIGRLK